MWRGKVSLFFVLTILISAVLGGVAPSPASAELSPDPSPSWGVTGLGETQFTGPILNQVFAIEQIGDRIYVGGKFTEVRAFANDTPEDQPYLAAFDVDSGEWISSFRPDIDAPVYALQASPDGSRLFVGGEFTNVNGAQYTEGLAPLDPITGDVDSSWIAQLENPFTSYPVVVKTIDMSNTHLYVGGVISAAGGRPGVPRVSLGRAAKLDLNTGQADPNWTPIVSGGSVWGIAVSPDGSRVHMGGYFSSVNTEENTQYFATVNNTDGELVPGLTPYIDQIAYPTRGYLQDVEVAGDRVWLGGSEHAIYMLDASDNEIERVHSTSRGGDYQDIEVIGDRVYGSCHCYNDHFTDYDYWVNRNNPIPGDVQVTPIKYVAAYDAISGDYIPEFQLNASALRSGVWGIHGDDRGCLWVGGDLTVAGSPAAGTDEWAGAFARFCESDGGALPAPVGLRSTFQDRGRIVLNFQEVAGAVDYEIFRDGVSIATEDDGWFTDIGLDEGTEYAYLVRGITANGEPGDFSTELLVSTTGTPVGGSLPAPEGLRSTFQDRGRIVLNYGEVDGAEFYEIFRDGVSVANDENGWFTDLGLDEGTEYTYRVRAVAADGTPGEMSDPIDVSTTGNPPGGTLPAPTGFQSTFQDRGRAVLNWQEVDGAASYEIFRDGELVGTDDNGWYTDLGLEPGTTYGYDVRAIAPDGTPGALTVVIDVTTNP